MIQFDDGSGPSLVVGGGIYLPHLVVGTSSYRQVPAAYLRNGRWTAMPATDSLTGLTARSLTSVDLSSTGGPGSSLYAVLGSPFFDQWVVCRWDGSLWSPVPSSPGVAWTLLAHTDAQGPALLAAGKDTPVKAWRGGTWDAYGALSVTSGKSINRLRALDDGSGEALYAIGTFVDTSRDVRLVAKFVDGAWVQCNLPPGAIAAQNVADIAFFDDGTSNTGPELYVTWYGVSGSLAKYSVSRWREGAWEALAVDQLTGTEPRFDVVADQGVSRLYCSAERGGKLREWRSTGWVVPLSVDGFFSAIATFNDGQGERTWFGGTFSSFYEGPLAPHPGRNTPAFGLLHTSSQGITSTAQGFGFADLSPHAPYLSPLEYPGGPRLMVGGPIRRAGGRPANGAAMLDDATWSTFNPSQLLADVRAATVAPIDGQHRIVASRVLAPFLSYWDDSQWQPLPPPPGGNIPLTLSDTLYSAGAGGLHRFNGSSWETISNTNFTAAIVADLGTGPRIVLSATSAVFEYDGASLVQIGPSQVNISGLAVVNDGPGPRVYILSNSLPNRIARLAGGVWEQLPAGVHTVDSPTGLALASFDDGGGPALYVAGHRSSTQVPGPIARWRNGAWAPVVPSAGPAIDCAAMAVVGDRLYIAGSFAQIAGIRADNLAWIQACPRTCNADFDHDGDYGTDADIEAFFACLAGNCCPRCTADFNADGDYGTDADIESFFRVLAGGAC